MMGRSFVHREVLLNCHQNEVNYVDANFDMMQSSNSTEREPANIVRSPSEWDGDGLVVENSWSSPQTSATPTAK